MNCKNHKKKPLACIVTYYRSYNYGSQLQSYALTKTMNRLGYKCFIFKRFFVFPYFIIHPHLFFSRLYNLIFRKERKKFFDSNPYSISEARVKKNAAYIDDNYNQLDINSIRKWRRIISSNMIFIAGSDIIWQPANGYPSHYLLDFTYHTNLPTLSYASSFGTNDIPMKYKKAYKKYLSSIDHLSVREEGSKKLLDSIVDKSSQVVLDPTLLLSQADWDIFCEKSYVKGKYDKNYILCYFVMDDDRYWDYVAKMEKSLNIPVLVLPMHHSDENKGYEYINDGTPYDFVWLIKHATVICTDSFHACVFSTIYNKEFYLLSRTRNDEKAKYTGFFSKFHLEDHLVNDETIFRRKTDYKYNDTNQLIISERRKSIAYLRSSLMEDHNE